MRRPSGGFRTGRWCAGAGWQEGYAGAAAAPVGLKRTGQSNSFARSHTPVLLVRRWREVGETTRVVALADRCPTARTPKPRADCGRASDCVHARHTGLWLVSTV